MFDVGLFLDRAKAGAGNCTDYRLAKLCGVTTQAVSAWRTGRAAPQGRQIVKLCELSGDDAEHVAACIQSMRAANDDEAALWDRVAARLKASAHVILTTIAAIVFAALTTDQAHAAAALLASSGAESVYYVKWLVDQMGPGAAHFLLCQAAFHFAARVARLIYLSSNPRPSRYFPVRNE